MAKKSAIEKNEKRKRLTIRFKEKRARLKAITRDRSLPAEDRFDAQLKLTEMPRDGSAVRVRNRCTITGRPRGNYRKFKMSRIALRELGSAGQVPGLVKSSW